MNKIKTLTAALALVASASAHALLPPIDPAAGYGGAAFSFSCLVGCDDTPAVGSQLYLQVLHDIDASNGVDPNVYFKFFNMVGVQSSVEQVSIDGMDGFTKLTGSGTNFEAAGTLNLPGGNTATPAFVVDFTYEAKPDNTLGFNGKPAAGINAAGETMEFYKAADYNAVLAAMASGDLRFGLHVIAFANGESATYLNDPVLLAPVPEPETWAMLAAGLGLLGVRAWRRRKA